jgi:hypothetical protein
VRVHPPPQPEGSCVHTCITAAHGGHWKCLVLIQGVLSHFAMQCDGRAAQGAAVQGVFVLRLRCAPLV